ncbi:MAG: integrase [Methylotenera sp.]|nr:MAG: integrase [Methylotenera sp.]
MATFRNRHGKWQARVTRKGMVPVSRSFINLQDAERWARQVETDMDKGAYTSAVLAERTTFKEIIERYMREVSPSMRGVEADLIRLKAICKRPICSLNMLALTSSKIAEYRDERLQAVSAGTVIRELCYFSSIINHARREWGININNPVALVRKPASPKGRTRVLSQTEKTDLLRELTPTKTNRKSPWMKPLVEFALETAMRRGEIIALLWDNVDLNKRVAFLPISKNGDSRAVPLSTNAIEILKQLPRSIDGRVFPLNGFTVAAAFMKAVKRANIYDLHFHDLRHTAITNMAEKLPNILELSAVTGHKTLSMLKRYTHFKAEELAKKLG